MLSPLGGIGALPIILKGKLILAAGGPDPALTAGVFGLHRIYKKSEFVANIQQLRVVIARERLGGVVS